MIEALGLMNESRYSKKSEEKEQTCLHYGWHFIGIEPQDRYNGKIVEELKMITDYYRDLMEKRLDSENRYKILGVDPNASRDVMKAAYKTLMKRFHADMVKIVVERINSVERLLSWAEKASKGVNLAWENVNKSMA